MSTHPKFRVSYKEPSWGWDDDGGAPCAYFASLAGAKEAAQRLVEGGGRFTQFRVEEDKGYGDWVVLEEIDAGPRV